MSITPQFTYDNQGRQIGVFLSMEDWSIVSEQIDRELLVPEGEKQLALQGMEEYRQNPDAVISWEEIKAEMVREDGTI